MNFKKLVILFLLPLIFQSCNVTKYLQEEDKLYTGSDISFTNEKYISQKKELKKNLEEDLYPKPNKKFLGLFYTKLWFHLKVKPKKEKGFKYWLKNKFGEAPVLIDDINVDVLENYIDKSMQDNGYFNTYTSSTINEKTHKASVAYQIENGKQTIIDSIIYPKTNTELDSIFANYKQLLTKEGKAYNLNKMELDRTTLAKEVRSLGYFDFDISDIFFVVDTSLGDNKVNLHYKIKQQNREEKLQKYHISSINVYPTFNGNKDAEVKKGFVGSFYYKEMAFRREYDFVGKKALYNNILIEKGDLFSLKNYEYTSERLNNLGVFSFVDIEYSKDDNDSLRVDVFLTPGQHQSFRADIEASTSNRSFLGSSVALSYSNRNLIKGAENFTIKASAGTEFQMVDKKAALNILDVNFEMSLALPRLLIRATPRKILSNKIPTTTINILENYQQWLAYYTLNSLNFNYKYDWQNQKKHNHAFQPLFVNIISLLNTTQKFDDLVNNNPALKTSFSNSVIIGRNYAYSVSTQRNTYDKHYLYFSGMIENAGNESFIIAKILNKNKTLPYKIFKTPFAQYTKLDADLRYYIKPNNFSMFIARFNPGIGIPYGNSDVLPYIKQFYMGGPNTLRAFQFRSVGPGRYTSETATTDLNPIEQSGDIRLMVNLEYRFDIYKFLKGAIFSDIGNVWLLKEDVNRPDSQFKFNSFYKQLAVGSGVGLRLDFNFFVLRGDVGIPIYKPFNNSGERWINQFPENKFRPWIQKNLVFNVAIGYPF